MTLIQLRQLIQIPFINVDIPIDIVEEKKRKRHNVWNNKKLPDINNKYYVEYDRKTFAFTTREDPDKDKKDEMIYLLLM